MLRGRLGSPWLLAAVEIHGRVVIVAVGALMNGAGIEQDALGNLAMVFLHYKAVVKGAEATEYWSLLPQK